MAINSHARFEEYLLTAWVFIPISMGPPGGAAFASVGASAAYNVRASLRMVPSCGGFIVAMAAAHVFAQVVFLFALLWPRLRLHRHIMITPPRNWGLELGSRAAGRRSQKELGRADEAARGPLDAAAQDGHPTARQSE